MNAAVKTAAVIEVIRFIVLSSCFASKMLYGRGTQVAARRMR